MVAIEVQPNELWDFIEENALSLTEIPEEIAYDSRTSVWVEIENDTPFIFVTDEYDNEIDRIWISGKNDAAREASEVFMHYLRKEEDVCWDEEEEILEDILQQTEVEDRENEIYSAFDDLLYVIFKEDAEKDVIKDLISHTMNYLVDKYEVKIHYPMYLEVDGEKVYEEYPYNEYEMEVEVAKP